MKTTYIVKPLAILWLLMLAAVITPRFTSAQTTWANTDGTGAWTTNTNWDPVAVPTTGDVVTIGNGGTARLGPGESGSATTVDVNLNSGLLIEGGTMALGNFNINSGTVTVTASGSLNTVNGAGIAGQLNVTDGGKVVLTRQLTLGYTNATQGHILVDGTGSSLTANLTPALGHNGLATVTVQNGGYASFNGATIGGYTAAGWGTTVITVDHAWINLGNADMGRGTSTGTMHISNSGSATVGSFSIGSGVQNSVSNNMVTVDGTGSRLIASTSLNVGNTSKGTLNLQDGGEVTINAGSGTMLLANSVSGTGISTGTLNIGGETIGAKTAGTVTAAAVTVGDGTGFINFNQNGNTTFNAVITQGTGTGTLTVTHNATGTTTFTKVNTYTGPTNITAGKLIIDVGASIGSGIVTVSASAALGGGGAIGGETFINTGATLAPDGILTFESGLTISNTATLEFTTDDVIMVTDGVLDLGAGIKLNLASTGTYTLFNYTGADLEGAGNWNSWDLGEFGGAGYTRAWTNGEGVLSLTVTPIPEPGTWVMIFSGLGTLAGIQRLRRRK